MKKLALFISGGGTTAQAIIKSTRTGLLSGSIKPVLLISNTPKAKGLERIKEMEVIPESDIIVIEKKDYSSPEDFGKAIIKACHARKVDLIGQYGWMVKTPENIINEFPEMMINQHPGPLDTGHPGFGGERWFGMRVHCARLKFVQRTGRDFWTEATAQRVHPEFDKGAILNKVRMPIFKEDTPESIQQRLLVLEHSVQVQTLYDFATNNVVEVTQETRLIRENELPILEEVLNEACKLYPKG